MEQIALTTSLAQEIRLAVAPVFLLTAIAGVLAVLSGRLGRAVDRARAVTGITGSDKNVEANASRISTGVLTRRIWLIQWAIGFYVVAALLICLVVVALFVGDYVAPDLSLLIAILFISAMLVMVVGLLLFLLEVRLAAKQTTMEIDQIAKREEG